LVTLAAGAAGGQTFTLDGGAMFTVVTHRDADVEPFEDGNKPSFSMPAHAWAELKPGGWLHVVDLEAWKKHFAASKPALEGCVTKPLRALERSLRAPGGQPGDDVPLGCEDASPAFFLWARKASFGGGRGWLFVTE
jgi:hypothetical protein